MDGAGTFSGTRRDEDEGGGGEEGGGGADGVVPAAGVRVVAGPDEIGSSATMPAGAAGAAPSVSAEPQDVHAASPRAEKASQRPQTIPISSSITRRGRAYQKAARRFP